MSHFITIALFLLFHLPCQQITRIAGEICVCQVITHGKTQWWTMNGWKKRTCNSYVNANNGRTMLMGDWRLVTCDWKTNSNERVYGLKSNKNGKWCCAENKGQGPLICNRQTPSQWEKFVLRQKDGKTSLQSVVSKKYIDYCSQQPYVCMTNSQNWMEIKYFDSDGIVTIKAVVRDNLYLSVREDNIVSLSKNNLLWEKFIWFSQIDSALFYFKYIVFFFTFIIIIQSCQVFSQQVIYLKVKQKIMQGGTTIIPQQILQLRHIFGINTTLPNSIALLSSDRIFYISGFHGVLYNPKQKQKSQSYFTAAKGAKCIYSVGISGNKKLMALGLQSIEKPCICYFQLNASPKRTKLQLSQNSTFTAWISLSFSSSSESKHLASLTNKNAQGQSFLVFWNPERGKAQAQLKIPSEFSYHQVQFNPSSESMIVSLLGDKHFKFYQLKQTTQQKGVTISIQQYQSVIDPALGKDYILKSHTYLNSSQHIVIITENQTLIVDYRGKIVSVIPIKGQCVANWGQGFLLSEDNTSIVHFFRYQDQKYSKKFTHQLADKQTKIAGIDTNQQKLIILFTNSVMLNGKLKYQPTKQTFKFTLQPVNLHFHCGPIVGMDVCVRKPLIATASKDKTIKIWNYEDKTVQTPKSQAQSALCLSFHPSGCHLAVAYSDKLRILNLQKDGESVSNFKDINSFRNCTFVKFSNGGQYFAAASANVVHVYKFYTGQNPQGMTFSGHSGKIKGMAWSKEDNILVTCGADGIIMAYRVGMQNCGTKLLYLSSTKEPRTKGLIYSSICINQDNTIYAMGIMGGTQRIFKEVKLDGTENKRELTQSNISQIAFPSTGRILFCGTDDKDNYSGTIKCYKFPNTQHIEQFQAHDNLGVEKICVTHDDKYLISAGRDGSLMLFEIRDKQARPDKIKQTLPMSNQILITKNDLDGIKSDIDTLKQQKNQLQSLGGVGPIKDDHLKQLKDKYSSDQSQFIQKYNGIIQKKNLLRKKFDEQIRTKKQQFQNGLQQYDSNQAKNVMQESAKYDQLKRAQQMQSKNFNTQIKRYTQQYEKDLKKLQQDYKEKIKAEHDQKMNLLRKIDRLKKQHEQTMKQIQQQKEEELKKISNDHSQQHQNITQTTLRANSDVSITNKKIQQKQQQKQSKVDQQKQNKRQIQRLQKANQLLQKQIENQALIIQQRDKTIDSNQRKIYELKKKSQQLQKFKYVLDHKIKQLKKDIAPRQNQIATMKAKTNQMDKQLKQLNSLNTGLAEFVSLLFKNQQTLKDKIAKQRARISYQTNKIKQFKDGVHQTAQLIQNQQQLKKSVSEMHHQFVSQSMTQVKIDSEIQHEYKNQKKYLEKSIAMLKKNLQKDADIHKHENIRIMKQNVDLIKQISSLRLQIREDSNKKGSQQKSKGKNEPKQQDIREEIQQKKKQTEAKRKQIEDLQQRIGNL